MSSCKLCLSNQASLLGKRFTNLTQEEKIDLVVQGKVHLSNLKIPTTGLNEHHRYEGVVGEFCQINWSLHKSEPSSCKYLTLFIMP